jgi:hypothetical protein
VGAAAPAASVSADYIGTPLCATCHKDIGDVFAKSGHPFKLTKVTGGKAPEFPFSKVANPPTGYTWNDITYVIGGYGWKARFIDKQGYIITGADDKAVTQYNLPNPSIGKADGWVGYKAGTKNLVYDCGPCHTTGYKPTGNQDNLPGLKGTWSEPGIECERCHGPGSQHAKNPWGAKMLIDRSSDFCGKCHSRDAVESINATGGFIEHHEQYEELFQSKHRALECIACHDPHKGVLQGRATKTATVRVQCESCHFIEAKFAKSAKMKGAVQCIECHMPKIVKTAWGDAAAFTGDIRAHLFGIDPYTMEQFSTDGKTAISQVGLNFACKSCHRDGGKAPTKSDDDLKRMALNYHGRT